MARYKKLTWWLLGLVLVLALKISQGDLIDAHSKQLIDQARNLDFQAIWPGYDPSPYPVEVFKHNLLGPDETILYEDGQVSRAPDREPVFALSINHDNQGNPVLAVTDARAFRDLTDIGQLDQVGADIYYQSAITHEAFHCFQSNAGFYDAYGHAMSQLEEAGLETYLRQADEDDNHHQFWEEEMEALIRYSQEATSENYQTWQATRAQRYGYLVDLLGQEAADTLFSYSRLAEKAEGTAKYIENVTRDVLEDHGYQHKYPGYLSDKAKYYESGYYMCLALDQVYGNQWKEGFFQSNLSLDQLLATAYSPQKP